MEMIMVINSINCKDLSRKYSTRGGHKKGREIRALIDYFLRLLGKVISLYFTKRLPLVNL